MVLSYVGIRVTDLEKSLRFYMEGLGLTERKRGTMSHGGEWVSLVDPESKSLLELNWYPPGSLYATPYSAGEGLDHIGCDVENARATMAKLVALGGRVAVEPWLEEDRYLIGFVSDPDGNWIELMSVVPAHK